MFDDLEDGELLEENALLREVLPPGWLSILHEEGLPFYYHKESRIVSWSRPYLCQPHVIQRHPIPTLIFSDISKHLKIEQNVTSSQPEDPKMTTRTRVRKKKKISDRESKMITFTTEGKTPASALLDYCRSYLKTVPIYVESTQDSVSKPFITELFILNKLYGRGESTTKKQAKQMAATEGLNILLPNFDPMNISLITTGVLPHIDINNNQLNDNDDKKLLWDMKTDNDDKKLLWDIKTDPLSLNIDDEMCIISNGDNTKSPSVMLSEHCRSRNITYHFEYTDVKEDVELNGIRSIFGRINYKCNAIVDNINIEGYGKDKYYARERASQLQLNRIYPHISSWKIMQDIFHQKQLPNTKYNYHILDNLKSEMRTYFMNNNNNVRAVDNWVEFNNNTT